MGERLARAALKRAGGGGAAFDVRSFAGELTGSSSTQAESWPGRIYGLWLDELSEPVPEAHWTGKRPHADRVPVYVVGKCSRCRCPGSSPG
jgi:hypothetical protein